MTILVVDDSRIQRNIIKGGLNERFSDKVKLFEAPDGVSAEQIIRAFKPDLVLLDWNMPQCNGLDLVKKLRSDAEFSSLPIIMITSESARYNVIEAVKAGVNDYIVKPVTNENLLAKIDRLNLEA